jgi:hypothetical protein
MPGIHDLLQYITTAAAGARAVGSTFRSVFVIILQLQLERQRIGEGRTLAKPSPACGGTTIAAASTSHGEPFSITTCIREADNESGLCPHSFQVMVSTVETR